MMIDAVTLMAQRKISELPVVDDRGQPVGLINITDVVGLFPGDVTVREPLPKGETFIFTMGATDDSGRTV